ncbi:hypothetical protein [Facklamia sp. 7083-14-GEN3]|uniref:hypothetical protein n=1 Tax=Facklamia sp. 7083-14-GEN3 TaxID=2973478 RepID=UPI00215D4100|nr:hypothetical protein [Facklamia sp. 7083-14-GEN3]MCR8969300.1 hypothetical protein [Facklamia sp. 7083-14-GEN3]
MKYETFQKVVANEEINDFLKEMFHSGCIMNDQIFLTIIRWSDEIITTEQALEELNKEFEFQKEKARTAMRTNETTHKV